MSNSQSDSHREGRAASGSGGGSTSAATGSGSAGGSNVKVNGAPRPSNSNDKPVSSPPIDSNTKSNEGSPIPSSGGQSRGHPEGHSQDAFSSWNPQQIQSGTANRPAAQLGGVGPVTAGPTAAALPGMPVEAYNNYYYNTAAAGFNTFSGDIRDSIAAIWSRTSPNGGEASVAAAAFSGGYGQFAAADTQAPTGQFAANLAGHFATSEGLGMFGGAGGSDYAAYGQQYGYGPQYTQWPDTNGGNSGSNQRGGYNSYLQQDELSPMGHGGGSGRMRGDKGGLTEAQHGLESMKLTDKSKSESNGYGGGNSSSSQSSAPKRMSWASVASQPAKPRPAPAKAKKPGVLAPPTIISASTSKAPHPTNLAPPPVPVPVQTVASVPDMLKNDSVAAIAAAATGAPQGSGNSPAGVNMNHNHHQMPPAIPPQHRGMMDRPHGPPHITTGPPPGHHPPPYHHPMSMPPQMGMIPNHHAAVPPHHPGSGHFHQGGGSHHQRGQNNHHHHPVNQGGPPRASRIANGAGHPGSGPGMNMNSGGESTGGSPADKHPVLENLKSANNYNPKNFDLNPKGARFFVIKSFSEDDIHRSIKYEIWCSTEHGNKRLDAAFRERNGQGPIYLLFSVNGSGHFCGVAEMLTGVDYSNTGSTVWVQDKFKGQFKVKWIYVKDVPNVQLRHIRLENNENKPVTNSRDTQEVPPEKGKMVLKTIHSFKHMTSIFDDFIHYEMRQKEEEGKKAAANIPGMNSDGGRGHMRHDGPPMHNRGGNDHHRGGHRDHHGGFRGDHHRDGHRVHNDDGPPPHHRSEGGRRGKPRV